MSEPRFSINFTGEMLATDDPCAVGDALVFDTAEGFWRVASAANRAAANARAGAVALTDWGGSAVGKVSYQSSGILAEEISDLGAGSASWVRVSAGGRLERCTPAPGDDLVGRCDADGRVHLQMGTWDSTNYAGGGGGGGAPEDATYVTLSTNGTLTNERVLTAGTGITVTDAGAGSTVTVAAPGMAAPFITQALSGDLANERVLTAGTGVTLTDGGAGSTMTVAVPSVAAQYVTLATSADLANERVLTAGTGITVTDAGAGSTVTVAAPGMAASFVTISTTGDLSNERALTAGTGISLTDGGAGSTITVTNTLPGPAALVEGTDANAAVNNLTTTSGSDRIIKYVLTNASAGLSGLVPFTVDEGQHVFIRAQDKVTVENGSTDSLEANRISTGLGEDLVIGEDGWVMLARDVAANRWSVVAYPGLGNKVQLARGQTFGAATDGEPEHRGSPRHYQTSGTDVEEYHDENNGYGKSQTQHRALVLTNTSQGDLHTFTVPSGDGAITILVTCTYAWVSEGGDQAGFHTHLFQLCRNGGTITDVTDINTTPAGVNEAPDLTWSTDITSDVVDVHILNNSGETIRFVGDALLQFITSP